MRDSLGARGSLAPYMLRVLVLLFISSALLHLVFQRKANAGLSPLEQRRPWWLPLSGRDSFTKSGWRYQMLSFLAGFVALSLAVLIFRQLATHRS